MALISRFYLEMIFSWKIASHRGRDRMVVRFTTTYALGASHHWCCEFESRSGWSEQLMWWSMSVTCDRSVVSLGPPVSSTNKTPTWYSWNIVESGVKHHQTNKQTNNHEKSTKCISFIILLYFSGDCQLFSRRSC